jgi:hypothetical protein
MIFLLNLELAFCLPPLGLNLFLSSVRFDRPLSMLYRAVVPFVAVLTVALLLVSYVPGLSTVAVNSDLAATRAVAEKNGLPPREAWMMECVQADPANPLPCSAADMAKYSGDQAIDNPDDDAIANP